MLSLRQKCQFSGRNIFFPKLTQCWKQGKVRLPAIHVLSSPTDVKYILRWTKEPIATPNTVNKWSLPTDKMPAPPAWVFFRWGFVLILGKDGAFGYNIQKLCISCIFPTRTSHTLQRHIHRSSAEVGRQMGTHALMYRPTHGRQGPPARGSSAGPSVAPPTVWAAGGTPVRPHSRSLAPAGFLLPLGWRRPVRSVTQ